MKKMMLLLVLPIFCLALFVSEAPAPTLPPPPDMSIVKSCTDASGPGQPIEFSAVITNVNAYQGLIITSCTDDQPGSVIDSLPGEIAANGTATIYGRYVPTTSPSTDIITCTGYGSITGPTITVTKSSNPATCTYPTYEGCTRTPGYWKNHPDAWPVPTIDIGGTTYTKAEAISWMDKPVKGDKTLTMFKALVAAKLNMLSGADTSCIITTIGAADAWMAAHPVGSVVEASSEAWKSGECLYGMLDAYNNGYLCVEHCD